MKLKLGKPLYLYNSLESIMYYNLLTILGFGLHYSLVGHLLVRLRVNLRANLWDSLVNSLCRRIVESARGVG
jgi:hypothetical protein